MLIRTQNRMGLVDISGMTIEVDTHEDGYEIVAWSNHYQHFHTRKRLGLYTTKERAIEVLDDISKAYNRILQAKISGHECVLIPDFVYKMPEK